MSTQAKPSASHRAKNFVIGGFSGMIGTTFVSYNTFLKDFISQIFDGYLTFFFTVRFNQSISSK